MAVKAYNTLDSNQMLAISGTSLYMNEKGRDFQASEIIHISDTATVVRYTAQVAALR